GNPNMDLALRAKYIAAFGSACYMSEVDTFDCFYKEWKAACADAVKIGEVSGNAPYDKGYTCQPVGNGDYTLQIGSDVASKITINFVRRVDKHSCPWGTNSNKNAAVISLKLNRFLWYKYPSEDEVVRINQVPPYTP